MQPKHVAMIVAPLLVAVVAVPVGIAMAAMAFFSASTSAAHAMEGCDTVGQDVVLASGGPARAPIAGTFRYGSPFGQRFHPVLQVWRLHAGADLTTVPSGGNIVAAKAGKVATVVHGDPGAGNFVEIDHGAGPAPATSTSPASARRRASRSAPEAPSVLRAPQACPPAITSTSRCTAAAVPSTPSPG